LNIKRSLSIFFNSFGNVTFAKTNSEKVINVHVSLCKVPVFLVWFRQPRISFHIICKSSEISFFVNNPSSVIRRWTDGRTDGSLHKLILTFL
jgi:hypothetical protein